LVTAYDEAEVVAAVRAAGRSALVLGGGSNLVLPDEGIDSTVVRIASTGVGVERDGDGVLIEAAAGEDWDALVGRCVSDRLVGVEALAGIPGLVGATPVQNVGAYGQEVAETIASVRCWDRQSGAVRTLFNRDCRFGYRTSRFKEEPGRWVVLEVVLQLRL